MTLLSVWVRRERGKEKTEKNGTDADTDKDVTDTNTEPDTEITTEIDTNKDTGDNCIRKAVRLSHANDLISFHGI